MNCEIIQHELLSGESPDRPHADVLVHLEGCAVCRDWQSRLLQIEHNVARLHVPSSATRDAFLLDLVLPDNPAEDTPVPTPRPAAAAAVPPGPLVRLSLPSTSRPPSLRVVAYQWRYPIAGVAAAAALLMGFIGWMSHNSNPNQVVERRERVRPAPDPLVANLMQRNLSLVAADKPKERTEALSKMAEDLGREGEAVARTDNGAELAGLLGQLRSKVNDALKQLNSHPGLEVAVADTTPADPARVKQLYRNRGLIQTLVDGGIRIAREDDSLRRADSCSDLARGLATEIRQAATARDGDRAIEMGQHLHDLLQGGVARNIRTVRGSAEVSLAQKEKMEQVRDWVKDVTAGVEDQLRVASSDSDIKKTLDAIRGARGEVENAVRG